MATRVRSYAKINLGLAIGPPRLDGFHGLRTLYQTLAVHDFITVNARPAAETSIALHSNDRRVPTDARNTAWKMVERALERARVKAEVHLYIEKRLPIQGGMGAGSANAAAALLGLERELGLPLEEAARMEVAAAVGSDVPLFLVGGSVLGFDRGQMVEAVPDVTLDGSAEIACVVALPNVGVSTPLAFREWDRQFKTDPDPDLHNPPIRDTLEELSRAYASCFPQASGLKEEDWARSGASGISPQPGSATQVSQNHPEKLQELSGEQLHQSQRAESGNVEDLAGNSLLALVRSGVDRDWIANDFETVVFPQTPSLEPIKRLLMGFPGEPGDAVYAALSGSGSALFGLYRSDADADAAQQRLQQHGVKVMVTKTMPRPLYWSRMFAE